VNLAETLLRDLHFGAPILRKSLGFTAITVLTLALGIGAATTVFSVAESILWKPLPFGDPHSLVAVWAHSVTNAWQQGLVSAPDFFDWQANNQAFSELPAYGWGENRTVTGGAETVREPVDLVTTNFLSTLGVEKIRVRNFLSEESESGRNRVAVVSPQFWERQFPGVPAAAEPSLLLDGVPYTVVGVLPPNVRLADFPVHDILTPIPQDSDMIRQRDARTLEVIGRLRAGVSVAQGQANLDALCRRLSLAYPATNGKWGARVQSLQDSMVSPSYRTTLTLFTRRPWHVRYHRVLCDTANTGGWDTNGLGSTAKG
jgi:putative ABC transport system permease protein